MTRKDSETVPHIIPFLRYEDAGAAMEWLKTAFGFREEACYKGPDGSIAHAVLSHGSGMVMLGSATEDDKLGMKTARQAGAVTQGIYVYVAEVDAHYQQARDNGARIRNPLADMEYGSREYSANDPEGNLWSFGTYLPGKAEHGMGLP